MGFAEHQKIKYPKVPDDFPIPKRMFKTVMVYFNGDEKKTKLWFHTENVMLGGISPVTMLAIGRKVRLQEFIADARYLGGW